MKNYIVYGSLLSGMKNHRVLGNSKLLGETKIKGYDLYDTGYGFPAIQKGTSVIQVEVYEVSSKTIERALDSLEGYTEGRNDNLYNKVKTKVEMENGESIEAYIYVWGSSRDLKDINNPVTGGCWRTYFKEVY
ncbi:MAG: gamma-glutamylcyclotransferase family protein [Sarcina sp.]